MAKKKEMTPAERLAAALVPGEEQPYGIPANWQWIYWGACGNFQAGNTFKNEYQGYTDLPIPFYKVGSLKYSDSRGILFDESNTIDGEILHKLKAKLIPAHSIIFAKIGEAIRLNRRSVNEIPCCIDNNMMSFKAGAFCLDWYAYWWSTSIDLYVYTNATTVPAIRKADLEKIPFPLPPLAEQERIVTRIENLFARLDEAEEKIRAALAVFDRRRAALLRAAFTGRLTAAWRTAHGRSLDEWEQTEVKNICKEIKVGIVIKPSQYYTTADKGVPAFRSANVREFRVDNFDWVYLDERGQKENPRSIVHTGDILIVRSGNPGTACVVTEEFDGYNAIDILIAVPKPDKVDSNFLCAYTNSPIGRQLVEANKRGMALAHFNVSKYSKLPISLPTLDEQREIVRVLDEAFAREAQARAAAEAALAAVPKLRRAVLARAFRGELGTNDPAEPPALSAD